MIIETERRGKRCRKEGKRKSSFRTFLGKLYHKLMEKWSQNPCFTFTDFSSIEDGKRHYGIGRFPTISIILITLNSTLELFDIDRVNGGED